MIQWDAPTTPVTQWEVEARALVSGGVWHRVGLVPYERFVMAYRKNQGWAIQGVRAATLWTPAMEEPMPLKGVLYKYRVRAWNLAGAGAWGEEVYYRATAYAVWL